MIIINLPEVKTERNAKAHPYPFQIASQTQEIIQGAIFYSYIADMASGAYLRQKDAINELEKEYISHNGDKEAWELGWKLLEKYVDLSKITIFQNVLVTINSQWDWYVRNLGKFVINARKYVCSPILNSKDNHDLNRIGDLLICQQIMILEKSCDVGFNFMTDELEALKEMSLVRNLALHNRWEVDEKYLKNTSDKRRWNIRELRLFDSSELGLWHQKLIKAINTTSKTIAIKYLQAPEYPKK